MQDTGQNAYVVFTTPDGSVVYATREGGSYRLAKSSEISDIRNGNVGQTPVFRYKSTTSDPITEFANSPVPTSTSTQTQNTNVDTSNVDTTGITKWYKLTDADKKTGAGTGNTVYAVNQGGQLRQATPEEVAYAEQNSISFQEVTTPAKNWGFTPSSFSPTSTSTPTTSSGERPDRYIQNPEGTGYIENPEYAAYVGSQDSSGTPGTGTFSQYDDSTLRNSPEFKALSPEDQDAVLAVFGAIAGNDKEQAARLAEAFSAASKINDPYFNQQLRIAVDAIERGYVSIDEEGAYAQLQLDRRRADLNEDLERTKEYLTAEQATALRDIERSYGVELENLQQNLAATGFTSSSRRLNKEGLLNEATGDLRESTNRKFGFQIASSELDAERGNRDITSEVERLKQLTQEKKLDFLRSAEQQVGTGNLPSLSGDVPSPLGGIYGDLPSQKLQNTINAATDFVF